MVKAIAGMSFEKPACIPFSGPVFAGTESIDPPGTIP
jgi:hypothetical protein